MLPAHHRARQNGRPLTPPIPPHPSIVQRRMELLTSDMLTRALTLVSRAQHERAHHLLHETRTILKGLAKGGLPPLPPPASGLKQSNSAQLLNGNGNGNGNGHNNHSPRATTPTSATTPNLQSSSNGFHNPPSPSSHSGHSTEPPTGPLPMPPGNHSTATLASSHMPPPPLPSGASVMGTPGVDPATTSALDADIESSLEWINHPAVFSRDSRKAVLQAIGVISSQRGYTFRTPSEALWAERVAGVKRMGERGREWRDGSQGIEGEVLEE